MEQFDHFDLTSQEFEFLKDDFTCFLERRDFPDKNTLTLSEAINQILIEEEEEEERNKPKNEKKFGSYMDELNDLKKLKKIEDEKNRNALQFNLNSISKENYFDSFNKTFSYGNNKTDKNRKSLLFNQSLDTFSPNKTITLNDLKSNKNENLTFNFESNIMNFTFDVDENKEKNISPNSTFVKKDFQPPIKSNLTIDKIEDLNNTFTIASNYDEVQEIARKQEEVLKRQSFPISPINNATLTKVKKNGFFKYDNLSKSPMFDHNNLVGNQIEDLEQEPSSPIGNKLDNSTCDTPSNVKKFGNQKSFIVNQRSLLSTIIKKSPDYLSRNKENDSINTNLNGNFVNKCTDSFLINDNLNTNNNFNTFTKMPNVSSSQGALATITKAKKSNISLKRTNTFKVREFQSASEENLNLKFNKNFQTNETLICNKNTSLITCINGNDNIRNYDTIKLSQRKVNKFSRSNGNINNINKNLNSINNTHILNTTVDETISKKQSSKLPAFTSRLKMPSNVSIFKNENL